MFIIYPECNPYSSSSGGFETIFCVFKNKEASSGLEPIRFAARRKISLSWFSIEHIFLS